MGQKVSPIGFRTGITIGWKSRWFAPKSTYGEFLVEDERIRRFIDNRLNRQPPYAGISSVEIERTREEVKVIINTARPGLVIGPRGAEVDRLRETLEELTDRRVSINIVEIRAPDLDAQLVAEAIAEQLKRRASFRRALKQRVEQTMQAGAKGIKITVAGRLGGREIARSETKLMGSIPLHTLEADVDYGFTPSFTTYGAIGVKVWIYRGMFGEKAAEEPVGETGMTRPRRRHQARESHRGPAGRSDRRPRTGAQGRERPEGAKAAGPAAAQTQVPPADQQKPQEAKKDQTAKQPASEPETSKTKKSPE